MEHDSRHELWQRAVSFAAARHEGQFRKDGRTPYIAHPVRVAMTVRHVFGVDDGAALATSLLHDLIEDTTTDYDDLVEEFGSVVAESVAALTKDSRLAEPQRELAYDEQLAQAGWRARLVKLADVYDNFCDSANEAQRAKAAGKARRAIRCAGDAPELQLAVAIVMKLIADYPLEQGPPR
jgi:guanosine-3',5'-bis(diphosphate) 3'-pyrophosphohydrolase